MLLFFVHEVWLNIVLFPCFNFAQLEDRLRQRKEQRKRKAEEEARIQREEEEEEKRKINEEREEKKKALPPLVSLPFFCISPFAMVF